MKKIWSAPALTILDMKSTAATPYAIVYVHSDRNNKPSGDVFWHKVGSVEGWFRRIYATSDS